MMEYWVHSCSIRLKNNTVHGINKPWIEKTSTEDLNNSEFGKMLSPFMSWPVKYLSTFHSNSRKWPAIALTLHTASRETFQKAIVVAV